MSRPQSPISQTFDKLTAPLPGWMLMVSGMAMLSMAVLIPAWLEARQLNWQRQVMRMQVETLNEQQVQYEQFLEALENDDPIVLERVAFAHLRLKPVDTNPIGTVMPNVSGPVVNLSDHPENHDACEAIIYQALNRPTSASVEAWLHKPLPTEGVDYQPLTQVNSRVVRIVTGPMRLAFASVAVLCVAASFALPGCRG